MKDIFLVHQRIAELWIKGQKKALSDKDIEEMSICMNANFLYCWKRAYLENISLLASMTNDMDWQHEICLEIDNLKK